MVMRIVGLSAFYHDSGAVLLEDGVILAAAQEERFTRKRHDAAFPRHALAYCLEAGGVGLGEIDHVAFYEKPFLKFERLLETYLSFAPRGFPSFLKAMPLWLKEKLFQKKLLTDALAELAPEVDWAERLLFGEHHQSHAASAFFPSPFEDAVVLTADGVGEWATTSVGLGRGNRLELTKEIHFPHSLGLLYSAFTTYCGFRVNSGEYKLMGLAPYGEPRYAGLILDRMIDVKPDGSFRLNLDYFDYCTGLRMTNRRFAALFGRPPRPLESGQDAFYMDIAASVQAVTEEVMLRLVKGAIAESGQRRLCLAGGVALNCVANGRILRESGVEDLWVQPAAGDAGGALGAALNGYYQFLGRERRPPNGRDAMAGAFLGPEYGQAEIERRLRAAGARFEVLEEEAILERTAEMLANGLAVGWFQGRMEFGPRALGNRSILADPRSPGMQRDLNLKVKFRESFRPFAPAVLCERAADWFELEGDSPYMLLVAGVHPKRRLETGEGDAEERGLDRLSRPRSEIPAVTHVDHSARIQTVHRETNPRFHRLIRAFEARTGCPVLVNTSFNVRGEPVVCTPEDAFHCFMGSGIDVLAVGDCLLRKDDQNPSLRRDYREEFEPD